MIQSVAANSHSRVSVACSMTWPIFFAGPFVFDEQGSYSIIDSDLLGNTRTGSLNDAARQPLSNCLQSICLFAFGSSEFTFRLPSAVHHLGAVVVVDPMGQNVHNGTRGRLATLVLAGHCEAVDKVRIDRDYGRFLRMSL